MKKVKVAEATNKQLDWLVAEARGIPQFIEHDGSIHDAVLVEFGCDGSTALDYTTSWSTMGPIIEREGITISKEEGSWGAYFRDNLFEEDGSDCWSIGPTPLIAAARCYVASKLGETVEVPEELE